MVASVVRPSSGIRRQHLKKDCFSETTGTISFKFHIQPPGKGVNKVYIFRLGHMTKMALCPYMVKTLKILLQNHWADCLNTWYVASGELLH